MSTAKWYPGIKLYIDPDAILDYEMDFVEWLEGETIANVVVSAEGCIATALDQTTTTAKYRVSAVTKGCSVRVRVTTSSGRRRDFTTKYAPQQQ